MRFEPYTFTQTDVRKALLHLQQLYHSETTGKCNVILSFTSNLLLSVADKSYACFCLMGPVGWQSDTYKDWSGTFFAGVSVH